MVEERFPIVKNKVMKKEVVVEEEKPVVVKNSKKQEMMNEDAIFADLLAGSKKFIEKV